MSKSFEKLLRKDVQEFIGKNLKTDVQRLILKGSPFPDIDVKELAVQIEGKNKSEKKLPTWFNTPNIIYPPKLNVEQASSEITARYKSTLIKDGNLIDLTGGFGVDDYYFSKVASKVVHCEVNALLSEIVQHNSQQLGCDNIETRVGDSQLFLKSITRAETIYVDPSRRANSGRVFLFKDCEPNVVEQKALYLKKANYVIIKAAPMLDIQAAIKELGDVAAVHIVSVNNECKELLFVLKKDLNKQPEIHCALLSKTETKAISFFHEEERNAVVKPCRLSNYLYEPDAAILKAGMFKLLVEKFGVSKIHPNSHLYTSDTLVDFPGKRFQIMRSFSFNDFNKAQVPKQINLVCRNFNLRPDELKKKLKLKDGGEDFLFFTTDYREQKIVIHAKKI